MSPRPISVRALIFDMDGTLYRDPRLDRRYESSLYPLIAERKGLTLPAARRVFAEEYARLRDRLGRPPSKLYTLSRLGISDLDWAATTGRIPVERWLKSDPRLRAALDRLRQRHRLGVVTNNHRANTLATLRVLGVLECFDEILTLSESRQFKPSPDLYTKMAKRLGVAPEDCLSVGDRPVQDLAPAAAVGMRTLWVRSLADVYALPRRVQPRPARRFSLRTEAGARRSAQAVLEAVRRGGLAVVPTDTVYGLAAAPSDEAVRWLYRAKGRREDRPLVLLLADAHAAERYARVSSRARELMARHWPGALTLVLPVRPGTSWGRVTRGGRSVGVRVPDQPWLRAVLGRAGGALATTSANPSGRPSPLAAADVEEPILAFADVLADAGPCPVGRPSTVLRVSGKRVTVLRQGSIRP